MSQASKAFCITFSLFLGIGILSLAIPNTLTAFSMLETSLLRLQLQEHKQLSPSDLLRLEEAQTVALNRFWSSQLQQDLVTIELELARNSEDDEKKIAWIQSAEFAIEHGLLRSPMDPAAWARLSYMTLREGESYNAAKQSLVMSLLTGPFDKSLVFPRIKYGIRLWGDLDEEERTLIRDQIKIADKINRPRLIEITRYNPETMKIVLSTMATDLERFKGFIGALNN